MSFKNFITESKSIKADYVMIHFAPTYDAAITPFNKKDLVSVVSEEAGFDEDEIYAIHHLPAKKSWVGDDVQIVRLK